MFILKIWLNISNTKSLLKNELIVINSMNKSTRTLAHDPMNKSKGSMLSYYTVLQGLFDSVVAVAF